MSILCSPQRLQEIGADTVIEEATKGGPLHELMVCHSVRRHHHFEQLFYHEFAHISRAFMIFVSSHYVHP
jgi:hypothetical protein